MNTVEVITPLVQKRTEGVQCYDFQCYQNGIPCTPDRRLKYLASFATKESHVKSVNLSIKGSLLEFTSSQILDLPVGDYRLELWEMVDDAIHAIYPSEYCLKFTVTYNTLDLPEGTVSSMTLDEFKKQFDELAKNIHSGGTAEHPKFSVGKTQTVPYDEPASVSMITNDDGTIVINYKIPAGKPGEVWKPYIASDGNWHIKEENVDQD